MDKFDYANVLLSRFIGKKTTGALSANEVTYCDADQFPYRLTSFSNERLLAEHGNANERRYKMYCLSLFALGNEIDSNRLFLNAFYGCTQV